MRYIIEDRYASIYSQTLPGYRVGPSSPVTWNHRRCEYEARVIRQDPNGRGYVCLMNRPSQYDRVDIIEAGQYNNYCPAVLG